jgi:accessory gene regulator B
MVEKYVENLVHQNIIESDKQQIYSYGIRQGILIIINIATVVLVGIVLDMLPESMVFLATYMLIRTYAGGYHAKSQLGCYIFSTVAMTVILLGIKHITFSCFIYLIAALISATIIYVLSPIENINKPLSQKEKTLYGKKSRTLVSIFTTISLIMWFVGIKNIAKSIVMAMLLVGVLMIIEKIINKMED